MDRWWTWEWIGLIGGAWAANQDWRIGPLANLAELFPKSEVSDVRVTLRLRWAPQKLWCVVVFLQESGCSKWKRGLQTRSASAFVQVAYRIPGAPNAEWAVGIVVQMLNILGLETLGSYSGWYLQPAISRASPLQVFAKFEIVWKILGSLSQGHFSILLPNQRGYWILRMAGIIFIGKEIDDKLANEVIGVLWLVVNQFDTLVFRGRKYDLGPSERLCSCTAICGKLAKNQNAWSAEALLGFRGAHTGVNGQKTKEDVA